MYVSLNMIKCPCNNNKKITNEDRQMCERISCTSIGNEKYTRVGEEDQQKRRVVNTPQLRRNDINIQQSKPQVITQR